jgi:hypothetical protein
MKTPMRSGSLRKFFLSWIAGLSVLVVTAWWVHSQNQTPPELAPEVRDKNVMKFKLHYAQGVLEAIATENYALMATNAQKLTGLSKQVSWRIRHTPEYERLTGDFRRQTEALAKAAKAENTDAATVAYFQMTVACVTCHKYLRGRDVAVLPLSQEEVLRSALAVR